MSCLGVHFALTGKQATCLLSAHSDEQVLTIVKDDIEREWDEEWLLETGHAWDAIHRCLTDGSLAVNHATPLSRCILGGRQLYHAGDYIISFLPPAEASQVYQAMAEIDQEWFREKYFALDQAQTGYEVDEDDFEVTFGYFGELKQFFQKTAESGRAVIFTVDQ
jgi:hypothetical protein